MLRLGKVEGAWRGEGPDSAAKAMWERGTIWQRRMFGEAGEESRWEGELKCKPKEQRVWVYPAERVIAAQERWFERRCFHPCLGW